MTTNRNAQRRTPEAREKVNAYRRAKYAENAEYRKQCADLKRFYRRRKAGISEAAPLYYSPSRPGLHLIIKEATAWANQQIRDIKVRITPGPLSFCLLIKPCTRCRKEKPIDAFGIDNSRHDDHMVACLDCMRPRDARRRQVERLANPERFAKQRANYKDRRKRRVAAASDGTVTGAELRRLFDRAGRCPYCLENMRRGAMAVDHINPVSRGGEHSIRNLVICCKPCNAAKSAKPFDKWLTELGPDECQSAIEMYNRRQSTLLFDKKVLAGPTPHG